MIPPCIPTADQQARFWTKVDKSGDCWVWTGRKCGLYGAFDYGGGSQLAHRVSWAICSGVWPDKCVLHKCDNPPCVNPAHLFLGTHADNNKDRAAKGRSAKRGPRPDRLTLDGIFEVRRLRSKGWTLRSIGEFLGVDLSTAGKIVTGVNGSRWV